ncbi:hypothetical protein Tco_0417904 [Tanacetum coccineum]
MQAAQDRQKNYVDRKRKPMEFEVGDRVMLKVSPWKGVVRFGKRGKLNPRYVGPFKVLAKVGKVAYRLELPQELSRVHHTFHVSNLKKCYADEPLVMPLEGIHVDDKLQFVEEPVEIMEREIKRLKRSRIPLVKVRWNSRRGPEFTWEREDSFKQKYPQLFTNRASSSTTRGLFTKAENYYCQANVNAVQRSWAPKLQLFSNSYQLRHCLRGGISQEVGTPRYLSLVVPLAKVGDEAVHKELGDRMERAATTASSLEAEQDSGSGPRCQDTILGDVNAQTRFEITSIQSIDPPLSRGYTLGSGEDIMSSASSAVTYTSVYTDSAPGRVFWGADEEISDGGVPRVIVYGYDGLPMQPVAPPSPDYVPGPEHPPSPDYVPGPEHPPSPIEIPFVPEPEYPEYLVPSEDEAPIEDQPLPADASPVALSPGYVPDSDPEEDPEEDSEEEHADYPADGGDGDDEPSDDDTDDDDADDDDEEPFEDEEDDEEEEEHLAPADSSAIPIVDPVPSAGDTEAFETDESAPTPRAPQIRIPFAQTRLRRARKSVRPEPPMSASMEARIAEHAAAPTPPLPVAPSPLPLPSPLTTSPTDAGAPLGYRAAGIRMRAADASPPLSLPPTSPRTDIPEAEMPPRKRACLTTPAPGYEIGESSAAGAARQPGPTPAVDTWDEIVEAMMEIAPTTLEGVDQRVTELDTTVRQRTEEFEVRFEEAHDDRAYLGALVNTLYRERLQHRRTALAMDREAVYARIAWTSSEERSAAIEAHVRTLEAQVATLIAQTTSLQTQLTTALGRIATLEARDPEPQDGPAEAGSSS